MPNEFYGSVRRHFTLFDTSKIDNKYLNTELNK